MVAADAASLQLGNNNNRDDISASRKECQDASPKAPAVSSVVPPSVEFDPKL